MMDEVLAVRRNPGATFEDVVALATEAQSMMVAMHGDPRRWPIAIFGPLGGLIDGMRKHPEYHRWARRRNLIFFQLLVWFILYGVGVKKRPGYNDFLLVRWALLGDEETALELIERSKRDDSVGCTLCWALRSLCKQYPEFEDRFGGIVPRANPEHMLRDAPASADPEAILQRSRWLDAQHQGGTR
jgi:hypothetical protein